MNLNIKDVMVLAGVMFVVTIVALATYDGGKSLLSSKTPTPPKS